MNNIDKYIKLNLSLVKGDLIGLVCCSVFASLGVFLPSLAIVALVLLVVIIVLVIRIYVKLFEKTLFKEEAVLYQSLPVSTEEIIVAKTFVATVATTAAWIGLMGGTSIGLALLSSSAMEPMLASVFLDLLNDVGAASAPIVALQAVSESFCLATTIFALSAIFNCRPKIERSTLLRVTAVAVFVISFDIKRDYIPDFINGVTDNNMLISGLVEILLSVVIGIVALAITKHYLDKRFFLE